MFSNLKYKNSHRIDYLNMNMVGSDRGFGIYIQGRFAKNQAYCVEAKHRLFASMDYVRRFLGEQNLVAVYVDVSSGKMMQQQAFQQMVLDVSKGYFNKVLFADLEELFAQDCMYEKVLELSEYVNDLEFFDLKGNLFQANKMLFNQLLGL